MIVPPWEELSEGLGWTIAWAAEQQGYVSIFTYHVIKSGITKSGIRIRFHWTYNFKIVTDINELGAAFMSGFKVGDKIISMDAQGSVHPFLSLNRCW